MLTVTSLLTFVVQVHAQASSANYRRNEKTRHKDIRDNLFGRALEAQVLHDPDLETAMLEKPGRLKVPAASHDPAPAVSFVFMQRVPWRLPHRGSPLDFLRKTNKFYHTEVWVCLRSSFSVDDQNYLDDKIAGMRNFAEIEKSWWHKRTASCVQLAYNKRNCAQVCCAVKCLPNMPLNFFLYRASTINKTHADYSKTRVYIYGTGSFDGFTALHALCHQKCWSSWSGADFNFFNNNCHTFTSTVLHCVFGLSQKKPNLGITDLVTVSGRCFPPPPHLLPPPFALSSQHHPVASQAILSHQQPTIPPPFSVHYPAISPNSTLPSHYPVGSPQSVSNDHDPRDPVIPATTNDPAISFYEILPKS